MLNGRLDVLENRKPTCVCENGILENTPNKHMETDQEDNTTMNSVSKSINNTLNSFAFLPTMYKYFHRRTVFYLLEIF